MLNISNYINKSGYKRLCSGDWRKVKRVRVAIVNGMKRDIDYEDMCQVFDILANINALKNVKREARINAARIAMRVLAT